MEVWTLTIGEILLVKSEPTNCQDSKAVAILKENVTVGHVPQNIAPRLFHFLRRDVNKAFAEVTGHKVNRGAGCGLEILCTYRLYGPPTYIRRMEALIQSLRDAGHLLINNTVQYCNWESRVRKGNGFKKGCGFGRSLRGRML